MRKTATARPFLKWAGGKTALWPDLLPLVPEVYRRLVDPFLGGGGIFFAADPREALLGDANAWLIDAFRAIQEDWKEVARRLDGMSNTREDYDRIREEDVGALDLFGRAANLVYLNKTGFRGLFRVNRQGRFNVPYGNYARRTYDPDELALASERLRGAELVSSDFEAVLERAGPEDFVVLDPPYVPSGPTSDFKRYTGAQFREEDHRRLARACRALDARGVRFLLTNSDTPLVHELWFGFDIRRVKSRREIHLDSSRRDSMDVVVLNYRVPKTR